MSARSEFPDSQIFLGVNVAYDPKLINKVVTDCEEIRGVDLAGNSSLKDEGAIMGFDGVLPTSIGEDCVGLDVTLTRLGESSHLCCEHHMESNATSWRYE